MNLTAKYETISFDITIPIDTFDTLKSVYFNENRIYDFYWKDHKLNPNITIQYNYLDYLDFYKKLNDSEKIEFKKGDLRLLSIVVLIDDENEPEWLHFDDKLQKCSESESLKLEFLIKKDKRSAWRIVQENMKNNSFRTINGMIIERQSLKIR